MRLFDETRPSSPFLAGRTERTMEFFNRVTLAPYEQARDRLETLFKEYPLVYGQKEEFKAKLWAKEEGIAEGAFYEMFMAGVMRRLSADCAIEAEYPLNGKPVDLRVSHLGGDFYVECKTRLMSRGQYGQKIPFLDELIEALDEDQDLTESNFIGLVFAKRSVGKLGHRTPSKRKFVKAVKERLPVLRKVEEAVLRTGVLPVEAVCEPVIYEPAENIQIEVLFFWCEDKKFGHFVSANSLGGGVVGDETPLILEDLKYKAEQHREQDLPYIIALNWCYPTGFGIPGRWDGGDPEGEAVYGRGHFDALDEEGPDKVQGGLFLGRDGQPRNRHVSGVLFSRRATLGLNNLSWKFFENPFAIQPGP